MPVSDEEKFRFDLIGFLVRPAILKADEIAAIREPIHRTHTLRRFVGNNEAVINSSHKP